MAAAGGGFGGNPFGGGGNPFGGGMPATPARRRVAITADENSNLVFVTGPADKIALAKQFLTDWRTRPRARVPRTIPPLPPQVKRFPVAGGNADAIATMLKEKYKDSAFGAHHAVGNNEVMVFAPVADLFEIAEDIKATERGGQKVELIRVRTMDGSKMATTLKAMLGERHRQDADRPVHRVGGRRHHQGPRHPGPDRRDQGGGQGADAGEGNSLRVISLDKGSGAAVAEELKRMLKAMGKDVQIVNPKDVSQPGAPRQAEGQGQAREAREVGHHGGHP